MNFLDIKIQTERLSLIPFSIDYAKIMLDELTDEITKYLSFYPPKSLDEEVDFLKESLEQMKNNESIFLMVMDKNTNEFIGSIGLKDVVSKTPEMGIWIKKSAHGKKIGREAATALKEWAFKNLDLNYILYTMDVNNIPSKKIAESLGGKFIKTEEKSFPSGKVHLDHFYHILS